MTSALRIAVLYPELLGTYGDAGNVIVLQKRLAWRGRQAAIVRVSREQPVPAQCDLYLVGGGEDAAQAEALARLRVGSGLRTAVARGVPVLAVCSGLQLLGTSITDSRGTVHAGLGLLDADTSPRTRRAVGEVVEDAAAELGLPTLLGFENHGGGTRLGASAQPLGTVRVGHGNGDESSATRRPGVRGEGALQGSIVATYLHGPVLARNPALADLLLARALGTGLSPLTTPEVERARQQALARSTPAHARSTRTLAALARAARGG
jgi:CobQ-like glutamine amidotransferase family enzyme